MIKPRKKLSKTFYGKGGSNYASTQVPSIPKYEGNMVKKFLQRSNNVFQKENVKHSKHGLSGKKKSYKSGLRKKRNLSMSHIGYQNYDYAQILGSDN